MDHPLLLPRSPSSPRLPRVIVSCRMCVGQGRGGGRMPSGHWMRRVCLLLDPETVKSHVWGCTTQIVVWTQRGALGCPGRAHGWPHLPGSASGLLCSPGPWSLLLWCHLHLTGQSPGSPVWTLVRRSGAELGAASCGSRSGGHWPPPSAQRPDGAGKETSAFRPAPGLLASKLLISLLPLEPRFSEFPGHSETC